jgi:hypothetical protein
LVGSERNDGILLGLLSATHAFDSPKKNFFLLHLKRKLLESQPRGRDSDGVLDDEANIVIECERLNPKIIAGKFCGKLILFIRWAAERENEKEDKTSIDIVLCEDMDELIVNIFNP